MTGTVSVPRAAWLLVRLRLRRLLNQSGSLFSRRKAADGKRTATAPRKGSGLVGAAFLYGIMLWGFFGFCGTMIDGLRLRFADDAGWLLGMQLQTGLLLLAVIVLNAGSRELARPEWDLEWLVTLPLSLRSLLGVRIVERTVVNAAGWLGLWPFLTTFAQRQGYGASSPLVGLATALPLLLLAGAFQTVFDTGLRVAMGPGRLRNLQAMMSIGGLLVFWLAMFGATGSSLVVDAARTAPAWTTFLPGALAVRAIAERGVDGWMAALTLAVEAGLVVAAGGALLRRLLRHGVVAAGAREGGRAARHGGVRRSAAGAAAVEAGAAGAAGAGRGWLTALQRRELRLLGRDRTFLVQTLVLPLLIVGMQFVLNSREGAAAVFGAPQHLAAVAFGAAAYMLMFSAFQALNAEGQALWLLYSFPRPLAAMLWDKARLWGTIATGVAAVVIVVGTISADSFSASTPLLAALVLVGIPIYAMIATSLGVFACDPLAVDVRRRVRPDFLYLYMLLASFYAFAIYTSEPWPRAVLVVLTLLLALALWQKAKDRLPYLLDPGAVAPREVSLSDGLIAVVLFFILQALVALIAISAGAQPNAATLLLVFTVAGGIAWTLVRFVMWRHKATGLPRILGAGLGRGVLWGLLGGAVAALAGFGYLWLLPRAGWFQQELALKAALGGTIDPALAVLVVAGAPLFEEWIFRGLVFGGLRRSFGPWKSALASAAIFAIMHPPLSVAPVFVLGFCAAVVYHRSGFLLAPMLTHALYNAAVLWRS